MAEIEFFFLRLYVLNHAPWDELHQKQALKGRFQATRGDELHLNVALSEDNDAVKCVSLARWRKSSRNRDMVSHFYRLLYRFRMRTYAEALFRRSRHEKQEKLWLQCSLMRLGSELRQSEHRSSAAGRPVQDAAEAIGSSI
ncbi:hypothetical protein ACVIHH_000189 [Bradyrhizobium sp. USDA 4518]